MAETRYYVKQPDGGIIGPLLGTTVRDLIAAGQITARSLVSGTDQRFAPITDAEAFSQAIESARPRIAPSYAGDLAEISAFRLLFRLTMARETGRLVVTQGDAKKEIFLVAGSPIFVGSNLPEERIGEYLVARKAITREQLDDALLLANNYGNHLGNTLMSLSIITPEAFYDHLVHQLQEKIEATCVWAQGRYDFFQGALYHGPKVPVELDVLQLLTHAARTRVTPSLARLRLAARMSRPIMHARKAPVTIARVPLEAEELVLYDAMNDMATAEDLAAEHGDRVIPLAYFFLELGLVELV